MKIFYPLYFFFCAGWGFLFAAMGQDSREPTLGVALLVEQIGGLVIAAISMLALIFLDSMLTRGRRLLSRPSFALKPWNRPIGILQFCGASLVFISIWALAFSLVPGAPSITDMHEARLAAIYGFGTLGAVWLAPRVMPRRFEPPAC